MIPNVREHALKRAKSTAKARLKSSASSVLKDVGVNTGYFSTAKELYSSLTKGAGLERAANVGTVIAGLPAVPPHIRLILRGFALVVANPRLYKLLSAGVSKLGSSRLGRVARGSLSRIANSRLGRGISRVKSAISSKLRSIQDRLRKVQKTQQRKEETSTPDERKKGRGTREGEGEDDSDIDREPETFRWITVGDHKVRAEHRHLHGKVFRWDTGYNGLYPGDDYGCRCIAEDIYTGD
jgi:SPP1 gp7 family putative phage head morphogenesis protein